MIRKSIILMLILLVVFISGCDEDPKDYPHESGKDFCTRYHDAFPSCWCLFDSPSNDGLGEYEDGALYKSGRQISNEQDAEAFFGRWLFSVQEDYYDTSEYADDEEIKCDSLGSGFYNCYIKNKLYVTVSEDGDIYQTECGI